MVGSALYVREERDDYTHRKARGAFFTPRDIAAFLVEWAIRSSADTVFEPSCGEAAFLVAAYERLAVLGAAPPSADQLRGIDIHGSAVAVARERLASLGAKSALDIGDFFEFTTADRFDAVVGNPPYVRYQAFSGHARQKAREAALAQGVRLAGLSSSWAAFVVHAASLLKPDGRLALVLPGELLTVNYAGAVRRFLMRRFKRVRLVLFDERVFPGVLEEVVLLLAEGEGPADHCELFQGRNVTEIRDLRQQCWTPSNAEDKWTAGLLPRSAGDLYHRILTDGHFERLDVWGETYLGMVTGNNAYFTLTHERAQALGLSAKELLPLCPPGSRHLRGLAFAGGAWREMLAQGSRVYLFDAADVPSPAAARYIEHGISLAVNTAYKCRVRSPWWKVPRVEEADAFFTYMNHDTPRIVTNRAGVAFLNSVHGIQFLDDRRQVAMDLLPIASLNSVTLLGSELVGRSYGGGMLKLEPKEADRLPVPSLKSVSESEEALRALRPLLAKRLRRGDLREVVALVDRVLLRKQINLKRVEIDELRRARGVLFSRRVARANSEP